MNPLSCDIYHCALRWKQLRYQFHGTAGYWLMILSLWRLLTNPRHRLAFKTADFFTIQITPDRTRSSYFPPAQLFWHEKPRVVSRKHPSTGSTLQQLHLFFFCFSFTNFQLHRPNLGSMPSFSLRFFATFSSFAGPFSTETPHQKPVT